MLLLYFFYDNNVHSFIKPSHEINGYSHKNRNTLVDDNYLKPITHFEI